MSSIDSLLTSMWMVRMSVVESGETTVIVGWVLLGSFESKLFERSMLIVPVCRDSESTSFSIRNVSTFKEAQFVC